MNEAEFYTYNLSDWFANELENHLPEEFSLSFEADGVSVLRNGKFCGGTSMSTVVYPEFLTDPKNVKEVEWFVYKILSDIQDVIAEFSTNVWPNRKQDPINNLALPNVSFIGTIIHAAYVHEHETVLQLTPLDISTLPKHGLKVL